MLYKQGKNMDVKQMFINLELCCTCMIIYLLVKSEAFPKNDTVLHKIYLLRRRRWIGSRTSITNKRKKNNENCTMFRLSEILDDIIKTEKNILLL